jgi:hypothetical protein
MAGKYASAKFSRDYKKSVFNTGDMMLKIHCRHVLLMTLTTVLVTAHAQQNPPVVRDPDYGGLGGYPVPQAAGGADEYNFCVTYAKRAWHLANMIDEGDLTIEQAKLAGQKLLGENAAREDAADFSALGNKTVASGNAMAAERFYRCAEKLQLHPQPSHRAKAENCFGNMRLLEHAARQRNAGNNREQVQALIRQRFPALPVDFLNTTLNLAYSGATLGEGSTLLEKVFNSCFSRTETGIR